ncbi:protein of unknown function [Candidatus Methylomirabilis oxygeniifera]|jgi:hypothetical protein|uniref:Uncharacterized protein n=1 Tax=Methylomirabilis oxygeniifera TaxID=671143 RepID=D5MEY2_METO1|nr:protein of unknown function [Candidatus Methylomirabilis oxyfera]
MIAPLISVTSIPGASYQADLLRTRTVCQFGAPGPFSLLTSAATSQRLSLRAMTLVYAGPFPGCVQSMGPRASGRAPHEEIGRRPIPVAHQS